MAHVMANMLTTKVAKVTDTEAASEASIRHVHTINYPGLIGEISKPLSYTPYFLGGRVGEREVMGHNNSKESHLAISKLQKMWLSRV